MGTRPGVGRWGDEGTRASRERGNIFVLFAIVLPLLLICCAIAIDVGYWWVMGKKAQTAADACALAVAQELPHTFADVGNCVVAPGQGDYVLVNLPAQSAPDPEPLHLSTRVRSPYGGDANLVEATVRMRVRTFFGRITGLDWVDVERRAVAERLTGQSKLAIFAGSADCSKGLLVNGKDVDVTGHVHSNGQYDIKAASPPHEFMATSGTVGDGGCTPLVDPPGPSPTVAGAQYDDGDWLPDTAPELQWPNWFSPADFGWYLPKGSGPGLCQYKGEHIEVTATHLKITGEPDVSLAANPNGPGTIVPTGTYCATGSFKINGDNHKGQITALAPLIQIGGNGQEYTPYAFDVLLFTLPNSTTSPSDDGPFTLGSLSPANIPPYPPCSPAPAVDMNLDGINYAWAGVLFNPCGRVKINNHDSFVGTPQLVGTIYGFEVEINGDGFAMVGTDDMDSNVYTALVE